MKNTVLNVSSSTSVPAETMTAILSQWTNLAQLVDDIVAKATGERSVLVWTLRVQKIAGAENKEEINSYSTVNLCAYVDYPASGGINGDPTDNQRGLAVASSCSEVMIYPDCVYWHGPKFHNLHNELAEQLGVALSKGQIGEHRYTQNSGLLEFLGKR